MRLRTTALMIAIAAIFAVMAASAFAEDVDVDDDWAVAEDTDGDEYYKTITAALGHSTLGAGDTIHVAAGLYDVTHNNEAFPLTMIDGVSLAGADQTTTTLEAACEPLTR